MKAKEFGELLAKIAIIASFVLSYCIISRLDYLVLIGD